MNSKTKITIGLDDLRLIIRQCAVIVDSSDVDDYSKRNKSLKVLNDNNSFVNSSMVSKSTETSSNDTKSTNNSISITKFVDNNKSKAIKSKTREGEKIKKNNKKIDDDCEISFEVMPLRSRENIMQQEGLI